MVNPFVIYWQQLSIQWNHTHLYSYSFRNATVAGKPWSKRGRYAYHIVTQWMVQSLLEKDTIPLSKNLSDANVSLVVDKLSRCPMCQPCTGWIFARYHLILRQNNCLFHNLFHASVLLVSKSQEGSSHVKKCMLQLVLLTNVSGCSQGKPNDRLSARLVEKQNQ